MPTNNDNPLEALDKMMDDPAITAWLDQKGSALRELVATAATAKKAETAHDGEGFLTAAEAGAKIIAAHDRMGLVALLGMAVDRLARLEMKGVRW